GSGGCLKTPYKLAIWPASNKRKSASITPPPKTSLFCQHPLDLKLDNRRFKGNNTHELIVLPVSGRFYRPIALVSRQPENSSSCQQPRAASSPSGLLWRSGLSVGALALGSRTARGSNQYIHGR